MVECRFFRLFGLLLGELLLEYPYVQGVLYYYYVKNFEMSNLCSLGPSGLVRMIVLNIYLH